MSEHSPTPGGGLLHPIPLLAIAVLVFNDHVGKGLLPGMISGKLSDVAGLLYFPLMLQAGLEIVSSPFRTHWRPSRSLLLICAATSAVVFALIQLWGPAGLAYQWGLGALQWPPRLVFATLSGEPLPGISPVQLTQDPTDLLTLPILGLTLAVGWRRTAPTPAPPPATPTRAPAAPADDPDHAGAAPP